MPLPTPSEGESQDEYVSRCISFVHDESPERPDDEIQAMCFDQWRDRNKAMEKRELKFKWACGYEHEHETKDEAQICIAAHQSPHNALKALSRTDAELRVANYIVLFGGRDLEGIGSGIVNGDGSKGEYFTVKTLLDSPYTKAGALYVDWEHTQGEAGDDLLGVVDWKTARIDDKGVFVERVLQRRNQYVQWLDELGWFDDGTLGTSSHADPDGVEKAADGEILRWPLFRDTITVQPMEPRMLSENHLQAFKALGIPAPDDTSEPEPDTAEATPEGALASVVAVGKARARLIQYRNKRL